ncbi:hypothetical protein SAMN03097699_3136 [Flavobacteriaceae bacterium MAR_2010_188]|nr:hypothetical protein SAMN03097699_3136 [Flavobacteriaceae bacterium MAR_2010_188]
MTFTNHSVLLGKLEPNQKLISISFLNFFNSTFSVQDIEFLNMGYALPITTLKINY